MWYALLIPVVFTYVAYRLFPHKITTWELTIPLTACALTTFASYWMMKEVTLRDSEYRGDLVTEARYYESYETWVDATCYRSYDCGTKDIPQTCQEAYDCSYCKNVSPEWKIVTRNGITQRISQNKYADIKSKWQNEAFVELDRDIDFHGSCGDDGDMYRVNWDNLVSDSESFVWEAAFTNPVKASHSAFKYENIPDSTAAKMGLYPYPKFIDQYRQIPLLSRNFIFHDSVYRAFEFLNADLGPTKKVKVFTLLFKDADIHQASLQEQYWEGGNQNEIVVCMGVDSALNITWVKPFSWCDNKRVLVDIREDVMEAGVFDPNFILEVYSKAIEGFHYKSFADFNYLQFEPTLTQLIWVIIITILVSALTTYYIIKNDYEANPI